MTAADPNTQRGVLDDAALRRVVAVLCVTEIVSWGILYYAFPVLAPAIAADTGWSTPAVIAAFSLGQIVCALGGIPAGRAIDALGPRTVMTTGSLLAVPATCAIALAPTYPLFLAAWVAAGVAMSAVLYAPSFAAVTGWAGPDTGRRVRGLTVITLVAGLASTVFAPLTAALAGPLDWRQTYLALAVMLLVVTVPAHALGLRHPWSPERTTDPLARAEENAARRLPFWLLALAFGLVSFTVYAVLINLVPLLIERGINVGFAAGILGVGGVGQVAGRLFYARLAAQTPLVARTCLVFAFIAVTTLALGLIPGPVALLAAVSLVAGAARGIVTLLQATAISDRWGTADFGRHNGLLTAPVMIAAAIAPWAGAALARPLGGYPPAFILLAVLALVACVAVPLTAPSRYGQLSR